MKLNNFFLFHSTHMNQLSPLKLLFDWQWQEEGGGVGVTL